MTKLNKHLEQEAAINYALSDTDLSSLCDGYGISKTKAKALLKNNGVLIKEIVGPIKPIFKWTGGKRREIKIFEPYFPQFVKNNEQYNFVEPFVGAGAVFFHLNNITGINVINDFDKQVVNFYNEFKKHSTRFVNELMRVNGIVDRDKLSDEYYKQRNKDRNNGLKDLTAEDMAIRFFIVNQMAFSGMRRFNSSGEFNVPFGHYKSLNASVVNSWSHRKLLEQTEITCGDFEKIMKSNDKKNTFIFLDPPYTRVFKEYSHDNSFGLQDHERLAKTFMGLNNAKAMLIIDKSDLTIKLYSDYIKHTYDLNYGVNIKNRFSQEVQHLIICNY